MVVGRGGRQSDRERGGGDGQHGRMVRSMGAGLIADGVEFFCTILPRAERRGGPAWAATRHTWPVQVRLLDSLCMGGGGAAGITVKRGI